MRATSPPHEQIDDVVPLLGFQVLDFAEQALDETLDLWQKRLMIDVYGPGPAPGGVEPE